jgi:cGMP-dependent protein kinase
MLGKGYSFSADIWTIGVILFEFLCGQLPFGEDLDDPFAVHSAIVSSALKYPSFMTDLKAKKVIDQLLSKPSDSRLPKGFAALKAMNYFDGFDW